MKTSAKLFITLGIIFALVIGFFIGISVSYPKADKGLTSATITKINNYRKFLSATSEINLKNVLVSDTVQRKFLQNYFRFYYITTAKMSGDIRFSIDEANAAESFKNLHKKEIENLVAYEKTLSIARTDLMIALRATINPEKADPSKTGKFSWYWS